MNHLIITYDDLCKQAQTLAMPCNKLEHIRWVEVSNDLEGMTSNDERNQLGLGVVSL